MKALCIRRLSCLLIFLIGRCATAEEATVETAPTLFSTFNLQQKLQHSTTDDTKNTSSRQERSLRGKKSEGITTTRAAKRRRQQQQQHERDDQATTDDDHTSTTTGTTTTTTTDICFDDIFQASAIGSYVLASFWHEVTQTQHCDATGIAAVMDKYFRPDCSWYTQQGQVLAMDLQSVKNVIIGNAETPGTIAYSCSHYHVTWATLDVITEAHVNNDFVWIGQEIVTEPPAQAPLPDADADADADMSRRRTLQQSQQEEYANTTMGEVTAGLYSSTFRMYFIDMEGAHGSWRPQGYEDDDEYGGEDDDDAYSSRKSRKGRPRYHHSHHQSKSSQSGGGRRRTSKGQQYVAAASTTTAAATTTMTGPCTNPKIYGVVLLDEYPHPEFVGGSF